MFPVETSISDRKNRELLCTALVRCGLAKIRVMAQLTGPRQKAVTVLLSKYIIFYQFGWKSDPESRSGDQVMIPTGPAGHPDSVGHSPEQYLSRSWRDRE